MRLSSVFALLAACALPAAAQDDPDCANQLDQNTMTRCAGIDYEKADAELNRVWPEIVRDAQEADAGTDDSKSEHVEALRAAQRAWISYRDAECIWQGFEAHGGSMEPMLVNACLADMTTKRIKELQGEDGQ